MARTINVMAAIEAVAHIRKLSVPSVRLSRDRKRVVVETTAFGTRFALQGTPSDIRLWLRAALLGLDQAEVCPESVPMRSTSIDGASTDALPESHSMSTSTVSASVRSLKRSTL